MGIFACRIQNLQKSLSQCETSSSGQPESWTLECSFGIPLTIGIRGQVSLRKNLEYSTWNPESTAWNPECKTVLDSLTWGESVIKDFIFLKDMWCWNTKLSLRCVQPVPRWAWWGLYILQANKTFVEAIKILYYGQINLQTQFIELCFVKKGK